MISQENISIRKTNINFINVQISRKMGNLQKMKYKQPIDI